jgi:hypothetical protein
MCEVAKHLLVGYLDALEEYDRLHLIFLAAYRRNDSEAMEAYRGLLREAKLRIQAARNAFQDHQKVHHCSDVIHLKNDWPF